MSLGRYQDIHRTDPEGRVNPSVLTSPNPLSTLHRRFACARLSQPYLSGSSSRRFRSVTTVAFDQSAPRWLGISDLTAEPEGPTFTSFKVTRRPFDRPPPCPT